MISLAGVSVDNADTHFVYAGQHPPVYLADKSGVLVPLVTSQSVTDMYVVVARIDKQGRFDGCIDHTTIKELAKMNAMVQTSTGHTRVTWATTIGTLEFVIARSAVRAIEAARAVPEPLPFTGTKIFPEFLRQTGILENQPYSTFASSTYPDPASFQAVPMATIEKILAFYLFCSRVAYCLVPDDDKSIQEQTDVAMLATVVAGATQIKYTPDTETDQPSMPMYGWSDTRWMKADCEDTAAWTVKHVCNGHMLVSKMMHDCSAAELVTKLNRKAAVQWIMGHSTASKDEAVRLLQVLLILWEYVPLHAVVSRNKNGGDVHTAVALATVPMIRLLFGKHAFKAVPPHMLKKQNDQLFHDSDSSLSRRCVPFVYVDATVLQPPTTLSQGLKAAVGVRRDSVFNSAGNAEYVRKVTTLALFGANSARLMNVPLLELCRTSDHALNDVWDTSFTGGKATQKDLDAISPLYVDQDSDPFEIYPRTEPTYPAAPIYVSLDTELQNRLVGKEMVEMLSEEPQNTAPGTRVFRVGCKFLRVTAVRPPALPNPEEKIVPRLMSGTSKFM